MLKEALGLEAKLVVGPAGTFEVAVDGNVVAQRQFGGFPTDHDILEAVRQARAD